MTKKTLSIGLAMTLALLCVACGPKKRSAEDAAHKAAITADTTLYVRVDRLADDSAAVTALENSRRFTFAIKQAQQSGKLLGDAREGDTLAVMPDFKQRIILQGVNINRLTGLWMLENGKGSGMRLAKDGGAFTIGEQGVTLRNWRVLNGKLLLSYIKSDGSDYKERTDTSHIERVTDGELVMTLAGKQQVYRRP